MFFKISFWNKALVWLTLKSGVGVCGGSQYSVMV